MTHARLAASLSLRDGTRPYPMVAGARLVANYMEDIYDLFDRGYLTEAEVLSTWGGAVQVWWQLLQPLIEAERQHDGIAVYPGFEALARKMAQAQLKRGDTPIKLDDQTRG